MLYWSCIGTEWESEGTYIGITREEKWNMMRREKDAVLPKDVTSKYDFVGFMIQKF